VSARAASFACALFVLSCTASTRDVVPETHDVRAGDPAAQAQGQASGKQDSYAYVARRPMGSVALSSERGLGLDVASGAAAHVADSMDACAVGLARSGKLVDGAVRVSAAIAPGGSVVVAHVTVAPGDAVAANALLCVIAPLKMITFAPADPKADREIALDATWGPPAAAR
jgi:hypothetical protein